MTLLRISLAISGACVFALGSALAYSRRRRKTPEQLEALRRERICAEGRITDGTVLDLHHIDSGNGQCKQLVVYSYDVRGVQYHCAQDLTALASLDLRACCLGDAASIKYDPRHPADSIVAAASWCGLRNARRKTPLQIDGGIAYRTV